MLGRVSIDADRDMSVDLRRRGAESGPENHDTHEQNPRGNQQLHPAGQADTEQQHEANDHPRESRPTEEGRPFAT